MVSRGPSQNSTISQHPPQPASQLGYHIRVIIPCYKEPLDVISKTVLAALYASIPAGCKRTGGLSLRRGVAGGWHWA